MQRTRLGILTLTSVLALAAMTAAGTVDNPQYREWARFREGAFVTLRTEATVDGKVQVVMTQTQMLKKLTAEKATVEYTGVTEVAGQTISAPPMSLDISAKGPKFDSGDFKGSTVDPKGVPKYKETKGKETLTVKGRKLDCEWIQIEIEGSITKTWSSEQVPGRMVKMESRSMGTTSTMQLTDWKAEKK